MTFGNIKPATINAITATLVTPSAADLRAAAARFADRTDSFANGKELTCRDLAAKLERFGDYASGKQQEFAAKLVEWSKPRAATAAAPAALLVPELFRVMQKHAHFYAERLKLSRRNQDTLVWVLWDDVCVGKIEDGRVSLFTKRLGADVANVEGLLREFDRDPIIAAMKYGKLSGRCCSCGRDLTNDGSIEMGIGPICARKFD